MLIQLQLHRTVLKGGGSQWVRELYEGNSTVCPAPRPQPGAGGPGLPLQEEASHFPVPRCVLFCRVLAVSLRVFGAEAPDCIPAPVARRLCIGSVGRARRGRDGGLFALAWEVEAGGADFDFFSASIESRSCANRAPRRRGAAMAEPPHLHGPRRRPHLDVIENAPGAEGPLSRRLGDWGLWLCGRANPLMRERAGLLMLRISPIYHTCPAF